MSGSVHRSLQVALARHPGLYLSTLRLTGRGSAEKKAYLALLRAGDVVFDVGANAGYFTLLFSDIVGHTGQVHAFEPVPPTFEALRERVRAEGRYGNISVTRAACAEAVGEASIYVPADDFGQASLRQHEEGSWRGCGSVRSYDVPLIALDAYVAALGIERVHFVKCDVEGGELAALRGMRTTLQCSRPMLLVEAGGSWTRAFGYEVGALAEFLRAVGYDALYWLTDGGPAPLEAPPAGAMNLLCGARARHAAALRRAGIDGGRS